MGRRKASERREPVFDVTPGPEPQAASGGHGAGAAEARPAQAEKGRQAQIRQATNRLRPHRLLGAVGSLWVVIAAIGAVIVIGVYLPPIQSLEIPKRPPSIQIVDLNGRLLATRGEFYGDPVSLKELPRHVPQAFIAIEDRRFYSHYGVDPIGVSRALYANLMRRGVAQGGSTITQQLAKNLFLTQERTLTRKVQELALALWLEGKFSKTEIIELYLNRVYFGAGAYGIEAAAQRYFSKPAQKLTVAEAAMLAGLVRSPSRLAPSHNPDGAERRAQTVLAAMVEMKFVTDDAAKTALMRPAQVVKVTSAGSVQYVADWVMDVLNDLVGRVEQDIVVETTIDPVLQAAAEKALFDELAKNGEKAGVSQGAIVSMTPEGAVRAMVGGRNYAESQFNRAVAAKRQPGSAFKPFVYLTAIERGLTPDTVREDKAISIKGWKPENYSREYHGPVTLKQALAMSLNTVAVRLTQEFGPTAVIRTAHRLGISSKLEPNASIALGTSEVSLLELVAAMAPLANGGLATAPHVVERVRTASGKTLYTREQQKPRPHHRAALRRDDERDDARDAHHRHRAQGRSRRLARRGQDRHVAGFPRRLVHRLHRASRHRRVGRQRRQLADPENHRRRHAGRHLDPHHEAGASGRRGRRPARLAGRTANRRPAAFLGWGAPAPARRAADPQPATEAGIRNIDTWLIDRLFGRR